MTSAPGSSKQCCKHIQGRDRYGSAAIWRKSCFLHILDFWRTLAGLLPRSATSAQRHLLYYLLPCYCLVRFSPSSHSPDKKHKKSFESGLRQKSPRGRQDARLHLMSTQYLSVSALLKLLCCCWSFVLVGNKVAQACRWSRRSASAGVNFDFFDRHRSNDHYSPGPQRIDSSGLLRWDVRHVNPLQWPKLSFKVSSVLSFIVVLVYVCTSCFEILERAASSE